jgi:hypothetical protein
MAGKDTPEIYFGPDVGIFQVEGISLPPNPVIFYEPVFEWIHKFLNSGELNSNIEIIFKLDYFNTSSMKQIVKLFRIMNNSPEKEKIIINWCYAAEDTDMLDAGKRFQQFTQIRFDFTAS